MGMHDAIVVGGGIVGISVAYNLVRGGVKTLLFDRKDVGRATDAGAEILSPHTYAGDSDAWHTFAIAAHDYYPALADELRDGRAGETGYARCGNLVVAASPDEVKAFQAAKKSILGRWQRAGRPSTDEIFELGPTEARKLFPPLTRVKGALYCRQAARMDGRLFARAMQVVAEAKGLSVTDTSVDRLIIKRNEVRGVESQGTQHRSSQVVIAGSAWSQAFGNQLGVQIPVEPQQGQIIHLDLPGIDTTSWPIVTAFHEHYIVPWPDKRVVVGATRETGSGFGTQATAAGVHEILGEAIRVAPGLKNARIRDVRVGLRPLSADGMPVLGPVPGYSGIQLVTGHSVSGLQLGPFSGKLIADLIVGVELSADIKPFGIARFMT